MIDFILPRLNKVRKIRPYHWVACCPAHDDKSPSLALRELEDGRILIKCMAECPITSVLDAMCLTMADLYPKPLGGLKRERHPFPAQQILQLIAKEATIVALCGSELTKHPLQEQDRKRLMVAISRIHQALEIGGVRYA